MRRGKTEILIIEDDTVDIMVYKRFIKENPDLYEWSFAMSLKQAKDILTEHSFDLVVTDYWLGDGTGLEIFDHTGDTPVVVVTGSGDEEVAVQAMRSGAFDYVIKDPDRNYIKMFPVLVDKVMERVQASTTIKLKDRFQGVIEMAGAACHELNQPLQAIAGYSELLTMQLEPGTQAYDMAMEIKNESARMGQITRKLNNITRYETIDYFEGSRIIDIEKATKTEKGEETKTE